MLILVSVSISIALNTGLFSKAGKAAGDMNNAQISDQSLSSGRVEIGGQAYNSIDEYLATNPGGSPAETTNPTDGSWTGTVNSPKLTGDMVGIYWDGEGNEITVTAENYNNWYDYTNQKWANAKTADGSYWVWIPRFEYSITPATTTIPSATNAGAIAVNFISQNTTTATANYTIHPAFTTNINLGGWSSDLSGIWVAKYEMSMETSANSGSTWASATPTAAEGATVNGNVATVANSMRMVSKPGVSSWRYINIANCYENSYNYDRTKESHLIKNSEWGAVAYLSHSQYGKNAAEITINNNGTTYYTAGATGATANTNVAQSSTGNNSGIFDLSGNAWEYVAAFNTAYTGEYFTGTGHLNGGGTHFASTGGTSTKYATAYSNFQSTYYEYFTVGTVSITGDAIQEVWVGGDRRLV